jgi:PAS domain S-box-containing protein
LVGAFLANLATQGTAATALAIATGNTLETLVAVLLVNQFANGPRTFERAGDILKFVLLAAISSTAISATVGVTALCISGLAQWDQYVLVWTTWWLGDAVGAILMTPLVVTWLRPSGPPFRISQLWEGLGLLLMVVLVGEFVFLGQNPFSDKNAPMGYLSVLPLMWAVGRFGTRGVATAAFVTAGMALWGALQGLGPYANTNSREPLLFLQTFLGIVTVAALVAGALVCERERREQCLKIEEAVGRALVSSSSLDEAAPKVLRTLCELGGWEVGALWLVDAEANVLKCAEIWHTPRVAAAEFRVASRERSFAPGVHLPGAAWSSGIVRWVSDVSKDPDFQRAPTALSSGLRSALCFPIRLGDHTFGVIECLGQRARASEPDTFPMFAELGRHVAQFTERWRGEVALRQAKQDLTQLIEHLDQRVQSRTAELVEANARLQAEVNAHEHAKQALLASETRFRGFIESSPDATVIVGADGRIVLVNSQTERVFGYLPAELLGQPLELLMADRYREGHAGHRRAFLGDPQGRPMGSGLELFGRRKDGKEFPVEISLSPVQTPEGTVVCAAIRDITLRKRLELEIVEAAEREQRRIAQDLHDGLGAHLVGTVCLSFALTNKLSAQGSPEASTATKISELLTDAVAQTRDLARGLYPVEPEANGLMSALEELAARLTDLFELPCQFECPRPVDIDDRTVATHLYWIAKEAATNAFKHARPSRIDIALSASSDLITLAVRDDGVGFRHNGSGSAGLGLRTMTRRASIIGGTLQVQDASGGGTEVVCSVQSNGSKRA